MRAAADLALVGAVGVTKSFRRGPETVHALRGVDLSVGAGQMIGIAGASGSGKSTLLAVLCGWETPDAGTVRFGDGAVAPLDLPWADLALVPQTLGLLDDLPALENVLLPARLTGRNADSVARATELMERLGVGHLTGRFSDQVSLGEQQRIAIARALLLHPRLLLADEPTAHQDHGWGDVVLDLLREHAASGGACILVSHHAQALARTDVVLHMTDGVLA
ncbi:MAG: ATP-binding cassette domain-containing protein [Jatrophihabitans sp.]